MSTIVPGTPTRIATPTDLGDKGRQAITVALNPIIADAFALYIKTKNFHWHVSGPHFRDYHLLFDEQADQILAMTDLLAERVRKLGGMTIRSIDQISKLQKIKDDDEAYVSAKDMLKRLLDDNKEFAIRLRNAHKVCDENNDVATASFLELHIDEAEKRIWFLFEASQTEQ
jgi:starvation-inducible DNA-binding protein